MHPSGEYAQEGPDLDLENTDGTRTLVACAAGFGASGLIPVLPPAGYLVSGFDEVVPA